MAGGHTKPDQLGGAVKKLKKKVRTLISDIDSLAKKLAKDRKRRRGQ
jgi:hypothetical protein